MTVARKTSLVLCARGDDSKAMVVELGSVAYSQEVALMTPSPALHRGTFSSALLSCLPFLLK